MSLAPYALKHNINCVRGRTMPVLSVNEGDLYGICHGLAIRLQSLVNSASRGRK